MSDTERIATLERRVDLLTYLVMLIGGSGGVCAGTIGAAKRCAEKLTLPLPFYGAALEDFAVPAASELAALMTEPPRPEPVRLVPCGPSLKKDER